MRLPPGSINRTEFFGQQNIQRTQDTRPIQNADSISAQVITQLEKNLSRFKLDPSGEVRGEGARGLDVAIDNAERILIKHENDEFAVKPKLEAVAERAIKVRGIVQEKRAEREREPQEVYARRLARRAIIQGNKGLHPVMISDTMTASVYTDENDRQMVAVSDNKAGVIFQRSAQLTIGDRVQDFLDNLLGR